MDAIHHGPFHALSGPSLLYVLDFRHVEACQTLIDSYRTYVLKSVAFISRNLPRAARSHRQAPLLLSTFPSCTFAILGLTSLLVQQKSSPFFSCTYVEPICNPFGC